jgi:hypothetical protein
MLQLRFQSNVLVQAQREATKLVGITERLYANLMLSSNTSKNDINTARESIEAMMQECNIWQERAARRSQIDDEAKKELEYVFLISTQRLTTYPSMADRDTALNGINAAK